MILLYFIIQTEITIFRQFKKKYGEFRKHSLKIWQHFFFTKMCCMIRTGFFSCQVLKIRQENQKKNPGLSSGASHRKEQIIVAAKFHLTRVFLIYLLYSPKLAHKSDRSCRCNKCVGLLLSSSTHRMFWTFIL